mgnify:CR=1 FL=1
MATVSLPGAKPLRSRPWTWALGFAVLVSAYVWAIKAPPFLMVGAESYEHAGLYAALMFAHVAGGTVPLFLGPLLLWSGLERRIPTAHRWMGRSYLVIGAVGALAALWVSVIATHQPKSLYVATGTLAVFWLGAAAMAYRAIRHRRIEQHREWMIRSYVLTLTFVGCRLANHLPLFPELGAERVTAQIWLFWVAPALATEYFLQWRRGAQAQAA